MHDALCHDVAPCLLGSRTVQRHQACSYVVVCYVLVCILLLAATVLWGAVYPSRAKVADHTLQ